MDSLMMIMNYHSRIIIHFILTIKYVYIMKHSDSIIIKLMFIAMEISALFGVILLTWKGDLTSEDAWVTKIFITLLALFAVTMQKEQQNIDWFEEEED